MPCGMCHPTAIAASTQLEVVYKSSPIEDVQAEEGEGKDNLSHRVDLTDADVSSLR